MSIIELIGVHYRPRINKLVLFPKKNDPLYENYTVTLRLQYSS